MGVERNRRALTVVGAGRGPNSMLALAGGAIREAL